MSRGRYTTKQQVAIESYLRDHKGESYTVDMLCSKFIERGISIGKATVYRCLERMLHDEVIIAIPDVDLGCIRYSYIDTKPAAFYLMCNSCHRIQSLHCDEIDRFMDHVACEHQFRPDSQKTIMYGKCNECGNNE